jgi:hypothetical protein
MFYYFHLFSSIQKLHLKIITYVARLLMGSHENRLRYVLAETFYFQTCSETNMCWDVKAKTLWGAFKKVLCSDYTVMCLEYASEVKSFRKRIWNGVFFW